MNTETVILISPKYGISQISGIRDGGVSAIQRNYFNLCNSENRIQYHIKILKIFLYKYTIIYIQKKALYIHTNTKNYTTYLHIQKPTIYYFSLKFFCNVPVHSAFIVLSTFKSNLLSLFFISCKILNI